MTEQIGAFLAAHPILTLLLCSLSAAGAGHMIVLAWRRVQ
jgi:hypothetical protein